jgi:hypothetical protein
LGFWEVGFLEIVEVGWNHVALFVQQATISGFLRNAVDIIDEPSHPNLGFLGCFFVRLI